MAASDKPFWETKTLGQMNEAEWESLCDACGQCCVVLLEDEEGGDILETDVCCRLFDPVARTCTNYQNRHALVPGCVKVAPKNIAALEWMPRSCAYRRLSEGRGLADWHPLVSGRAESVVEAGIAVPDDLTSETRVKARHLWRRVTGRRA